VYFLVVARLAGVDLVVPKAVGSPSRDVLAATAAATVRFGVSGPSGGDGVTGRGRVVGSRLLSPGWPARLSVVAR